MGPVLGFSKNRGEIVGRFCLLLTLISAINKPDKNDQIEDIMSKLELSFLGLFSAKLDGAPVTSFESNKVRALLAYLAVEVAAPSARTV